MRCDLFEYLLEEWKVGHSHVIGFMNAIRHILDIRRICSAIAKYNKVRISAIRYLRSKN